MKSYTFDAELIDGLAINKPHQSVTLLLRIAELVILGIGIRHKKEHPHGLRCVEAILFSKDGTPAVKINGTAVILQSQEHLFVLVKGGFNTAVDYDASQFIFDKQRQNIAVIMPIGEVIRVWRGEHHSLLTHNAMTHELEVRNY